MGRFSDADPAYLRQEQYADASRLGDRMNLHEHFSVNPQGWHRWVFEQLDLGPGCGVLEAACGPGALWTRNLDRLPPETEVVLTDFSPGMVAAAAAALPGVPGFGTRVADVQDLPFDDDAFDVVICNHALYHVPDRPRAISELRRVTRPTGAAWVATNGLAHLDELDALRRRRLREWRDGTARAFGLENGAAQLGAAFGAVELRRYQDALRVTEVTPLVAFAVSTLSEDECTTVESEAMAAEVEATIATEGWFAVTKDSGIFVCR